MKYKVFLHLMVFSVMLLFSSCSEIVELDELAVFSGIGLDQGTDKKLDATMQVILHRQLKVQSQGTPIATTNVLVDGDNIIDVNRNFTLKSGRKGIWSHAKVIVIGEELAKKGIGDVIDVLERDHEVRRRTYLIIAKGMAGDILSAETTHLESIQAYNISDMVEMNDRNGYVIPVDINRYGITTSPNNDSAFITGISLLPESETTAKAKTRIKLDGTAIFKKDKLVGWFDETETRGLLWVLGEIKSCIENIKYPGKEDPVSIEIHKSKSKVIPVFENQTIKKFQIEVDCTGSIAHSNPNVQLMDEDELKKIEKKVEEQIENQIHKSIEKAQDYHTDVFGFNEAVNNKNPKLFKSIKDNWDEIFASLEVDIKINFTLQRTGLTTKREDHE